MGGIGKQRAYDSVVRSPCYLTTRLVYPEQPVIEEHRPQRTGIRRIMPLLCRKGLDCRRIKYTLSTKRNEVARWAHPELVAAPFDGEPSALGISSVEANVESHTGIQCKDGVLTFNFSGNKQALGGANDGENGIVRKAKSLK